MRFARTAALTAAAASLPLAAAATDGYFSHGYGMKAKGMGGTATAVAQDAFGGANNPATMAFAGSQWAIGLDWFSPHRSAQRTGGRRSAWTGPPTAAARTSSSPSSP